MPKTPGLHLLSSGVHHTIYRVKQVGQCTRERATFGLRDVA
jgi:hypothetical protein